MTHPVSLGITLGLFLGKQFGVFLFCMAGVLFGLARLPNGVTPVHLYGVALLCGIGFTMSLFIGSLAFEERQVPAMFDERIGILLGSLLSAMAGFLLLLLTLGKEPGHAGSSRKADRGSVAHRPTQSGLTRGESTMRIWHDLWPERLVLFAMADGLALTFMLTR